MRSALWIAEGWENFVLLANKKLVYHFRELKLILLSAKPAKKFTITASYLRDNHRGHIVQELIRAG